MSHIIETKSGAELKLNIAPMADVLALKNAVTSEIGKAGIDIKANSSSFFQQDVSKLIPVLAALDSSESIQKALFKCAEKSTYDKKKINIELFDDVPEARGDYYEIIFNVLKVNLSTFFKNAASMFSEVMEKSNGFQK